MEKLPQPTQTHIISNVYKHNPPILINDNLSSSHCETDTDIIETNEYTFYHFRFALIIDSTSSKFPISLFASFIILMISAFISCGFCNSNFTQYPTLIKLLRKVKASVIILSLFYPIIPYNVKTLILKYYLSNIE